MRNIVAVQLIDDHASLFDRLDQHFVTGPVNVRHSHPVHIHNPLLYAALRQALRHLQVAGLVLAMQSQVLEKLLPVAGVRNTVFLPSYSVFDDPVATWGVPPATPG
jgi:hypothetical protein